MSTSRYDGFVVWGHGLPYIREIMSVIRSRFDVIIILRKKIDDIRSFVDSVYDLDTYPKELIREKTGYLLKEKKEAALVLVRNNNVDLWDVDMGKYAKKECRYVAHTKVVIREMYNVHPHHHVIHATDNEEQTEHLLSLFGGREIGHYVGSGNGFFPFHIAPFEFDTVLVDIRSLEGRIAGTLWNRGVEHTPHYLYVMGNKEPYNNYVDEHYGYTLIEDHFPEKFDAMIEAYDKGATFPPVLIGNGAIIDGGHRAAIMMARGVREIMAHKQIMKPQNKPTRKRILLVGGTGAVGQSLLDAFDHNKYEVSFVGSSFINVTDPSFDYKKFEDPEVVVNLSGIIFKCPLSENHQDTKKLIEANCLGSVNLIAGVLPMMRKRKYGTIILMSSVFSSVNVNGYGVYSASKAFIDRLVKTAATENAKYQISINSIQLGYTGVGMGDVSNEIKADVIKKIPAKRFCSPREIANLISCFVETPYITGQSIRIDGGLQ